MSSIIADVDVCEKFSDNNQEMVDVQECQTPREINESRKQLPCKNVMEFNVTNKDLGAGCSCRMSNVKLDESQRIGEIINQMLKRKNYERATIKLDIEFSYK